MNVFLFNQFQILVFFLALVRVSCLLAVMPIFSHLAIPSTVKLLFGFAIALIMYPLVQSQSYLIPANTFDSGINIFVVVIKEVLVGVIVGFVAKTFFEALSFAFTFMTTQMGFGMSSLYDPHIEANVPVLSQFITILAALLFLAADGHHALIQAMAETFKIIPVGLGGISHGLTGYMMELGSEVFWIAVRLSAPMAVVIFLTNCAFGIVAKAVPQINVMVVSFTVNILLGLFVLVLTLPVFGANMNDIFAQMFEKTIGVLRYLNG